MLPRLLLAYINISLSVVSVTDSNLQDCVYSILTRKMLSAMYLINSSD